MKIIRTVAEMQQLSESWRQQQLSIGFVPTMGFLHEGHLSLVDLANSCCDRTVVSIFINPTQFGPEEDFDEYPRDLARDEDLCRQKGADALFYPDQREMYAADFSTWVQEINLSKSLCGRSRPTHFRGVTTVVTKLFNIVNPHVAVFGSKDAQQALIIQRLTRDLNFPIRIVLGPIVREADGLAMSSRNRYLNPDQRKRALALYDGLQKAAEAYEQGERQGEVLKGLVRDRVQEAGGIIDYVELVSQDTLSEVSAADGPVLLAVAAFFGETRLIDNCFFG